MKKKDGSSYDEIFSSITPQNNFELKNIPVEPNYEDKYFWAAFPGEKSVANLNTEKIQLNNEPIQQKCQISANSCEFGSQTDQTWLARELLRSH